MSILFPYFELLASLFVLIFTFIIFSHHYANKSAWFFARFALLAFLSCILTYSLRIAFTLELAAIINKLSVSLIAFCFAVYVHFALIFTHQEKWLKKKYSLWLMYLPPTIVSSFFLLTSLMYQRYEIMPYGIVSIPTPYYWIFLIYSISFNVIGIGLFLNFARKAHQKIVKEQAFLIALGSLIPVTIGLVTDEFLPLFLQSRPIFPTVIFDFAVMTFFIFLAMRRYSLFAISPALAADIIIETMPDSLIVTDLSGRVIILNQEAHKYFHAPKDEILGRKISALFENKEDYAKLQKDIIEKKMEVERFKAALCDPAGECLPSLINANALHDTLGVLIGIIFVIRDSRS